MRPHLLLAAPLLLLAQGSVRDDLPGASVDAAVEVEGAEPAPSEKLKCLLNDLRSPVSSGVHACDLPSEQGLKGPTLTLGFKRPPWQNGLALG